MKHEMKLEDEVGMTLVKIGDAAEFLHVSAQTLRSWTEQGKISATVSAGGHRLYAEKDLFRCQREQSGVDGYWAAGAVVSVTLSDDDELQFSELESMEVAYVPFSRYWGFRNGLEKTAAKVAVQGYSIAECDAVQPGGGSLTVFLGVDSVDKDRLGVLFEQAVAEAKVWVKANCTPVRTVVWKSLKGRDIPLDGY